MMARSTMDSGAVKAWFQSVRPVSLWLLILAVVLFLAMTWFANQVTRPTDWFPGLAAASGHVISTTFLNYIPMFIIMGLLLVLVGRLRCNDLALIRQRFLPGLAWVVCTWIVVQLLVVLIQKGAVSLDPSWDGQVVKKISLLVTGQLLGNALYEELFWRAFLISQLVLLMTRVMKLRMRTALAWAIIISSVLFALFHIPNDLLHGREILPGQWSRLISGIVFGSLFLLSNNIFLVIGIHGLANKPLFLFQDSGDVKEVIWFAPLVVLLVMAVLRRFRQPRTAS
ncbi:MAG: CPBP family intramembrane metalloprotease [Phycisphaerales bacterium]|nr:CPBP family intramembrane metalloprotease [Phycisphaerales bacterium]